MACDAPTSQFFILESGQCAVETGDGDVTTPTNVGCCGCCGCGGCCGCCGSCGCRGSLAPWLLCPFAFRSVSLRHFKERKTAPACRAVPASPVSGALAGWAQVLVLANGSSFGESSLLHETLSNRTIRAKSACVLWSLDRRCYKGIVVQTNSQRKAKYEKLVSGVRFLDACQDSEKSMVNHPTPAPSSPGR